MKVEKKLLFVGAGAMAEALIRGLLATGYTSASNIYVANQTNFLRLMKLEREYGIQTVVNFETAMDIADIVILATKPAAIGSVCESLAVYMRGEQIFISLAAGVRTSFIEKKLANYAQVIRTMPNTSSSVGKSMTGLVKGKFTSQESLEEAEKIFTSIGQVLLVEEEQMDLLTAISGSGPAYIYYLVENMERAAIELGLETEAAKLLVRETISGALAMLESTGEEAEDLRKKVTSPNGTTAAGLKVLEEKKLNEIIHATFVAAQERARQMGEEIEGRDEI